MGQDGIPQGDPPSGLGAPPSGLGAFLRQPLTKVQALVGLGAGIVTITGSMISLVGLSFSAAAPTVASTQGEVVAIVHDAQFRKPVTEAIVEILTSKDAVVTTLTVEGDGRVSRRLKEGQYRVRVTHPKFATEARQVEVQAGQRSEVRVALVPRPLPPPPPPPVARPVPPAPPATPAPHSPPALHAAPAPPPAAPPPPPTVKVIEEPNAMQKFLSNLGY